MIYRVLPVIPFKRVGGDKSEQDEDVTSFPRLPQGKLLRIAKKAPGVSYSTAQTQDYFKVCISQMFSARYLLSQELVEIGASVITQLNENLKRAETNDTRKPSRKGIYLRDDGHALLIEDMSLSSERGFLVQFKPKWLVQSPTAPSWSVRCRTCALRAASTFVRDDWVPRGTPYCPMTLTSGNREHLSHTVEKILAEQADFDSLDAATKERLRERLIACLLKGGLRILTRLAKLQRLLDQFGAFEEDKNGSNFHTGGFTAAMTLRDCTLYLRFFSDERIPVEAKFGDLDRKSKGNGKLQYWQYVEHRLIRGGWYMGLEPEKLGEETCLLSKRFPEPPYWW